MKNGLLLKLEELSEGKLDEDVLYKLLNKRGNWIQKKKKKMWM